MIAGFDPERESSGVLSIDALCCNRDLPAALPFGGGRPALRLVEGAAAVTGLACLTAPTPTLRLPLRERGFWRLISHLSLGHPQRRRRRDRGRGLARGAAPLRLPRHSPNRAPRSAPCSVSRRGPAPRAFRDCAVPARAAGGFCRGLDVTLTFDDAGLDDGRLYVLASVLDRFLALHATVNSFVRTRAVLRGRPGVAASWPARAGSQVLL